MPNQLAYKGGMPLRSKPFTRWPVHDEEERRLLLEVYDSGVWSFSGPREMHFARQFADFVGAKEGFCVANGSVSLEIALRALGVGPGDEVILPALTWYATAWAVVQVGAVPVFVDVQARDWCIDPADIRAKITPRTRAIIPVHLYNQIAEMDEIMQIAQKNSLFILEDCAHTHGSRWGDRGIGSLGKIGSFSFQQSKGMTAGEGGILVTSDDELACQIHGLKNCGRSWNGHFTFGSNYRMTEFQAVILNCQLARLESDLARKWKNIEIFREKIEKVPGISTLAPKSKVTRQGFYGFPLRLDLEAFDGVPRDLLLNALRAEGIPLQAPYETVYQAVPWTMGAKYCKFEKGAKPEERLGLNAHCPLTEKISREEGIVILHHVFLGTPEDMDDLAEAFVKVQRNISELKIDALEKKLKGAARSVLKKLGLNV